MRRVAMLAVILVGIASCGDDPEPPRDPPAAAPSDSGRVLVADDRSFERIAVEPDGPVLVVFFAPWSGPDRVVLEHLAPIAAERPGLRVVKVDVDKSPRASQRYDVQAVPTAIVLRRGDAQGTPVVGAMQRRRWERELGLDALGSP